MARYIDADKLINHFNALSVYDGITLIRAIQEQPAADVAPVKRGMWRVTHELESWDIVYCSECGEGMWNKKGDKLPNYCYNCGAKMDGGENV